MIFNFCIIGTTASLALYEFILDVTTLCEISEALIDLSCATLIVL